MRFALHIPNDGLSNFPAHGAAADDRLLEMRQQIGANRAVAKLKASAARRRGRGRGAAPASETPTAPPSTWRPARDFRLMPRR